MIHFATDGVPETHVDNGSPAARGFTKTWGYTLYTDEYGTVLRGEWDDNEERPDLLGFHNNPTTAARGGSENPYLTYGSVLGVVGEDIVRK